MKKCLILFITGKRKLDFKNNTVYQIYIYIYIYTYILKMQRNKNIWCEGMCEETGF